MELRWQCMKIENSIYLSIASYMDLELIDTVYSALSNAKNTKNIFVSICSQDEDNAHPNLEGLFHLFNVLGFNYIRMNYKDARGVGFARSKAQEALNKDHEFYIQVDSHTQFLQDWDIKLIDYYKKLETYWDSKIILTHYPPSYVYTDYGNIRMPDKPETTCVRVQYSQNEDLFYEPKYKDWQGNEYGDYHAYFCAGFAFGRSEYFLETPYDPEIYFNGEEQTLSIRFYCRDIKLISPESGYVFHHYDGTRRSRNWERTPNWNQYDEASKVRLFNFYAGNDIGTYSLPNLTKYVEWIDKFVGPWKKDL